MSVFTYRNEAEKIVAIARLTETVLKNCAPFHALLIAALALCATAAHATDVKSAIPFFWAPTQAVAICSGYPNPTPDACEWDVLKKGEVLEFDETQVSVLGRTDIIALIRPLCPGVDHGCAPFEVPVYVRTKDFNEFFKPAPKPKGWL
jgi:hypothetical protein